MSLYRNLVRSLRLPQIQTISLDFNPSSYLLPCQGGRRRDPPLLCSVAISSSPSSSPKLSLYSSFVLVSHPHRRNPKSDNLPFLIETYLFFDLLSLDFEFSIFDCPVADEDDDDDGIDNDEDHDSDDDLEAEKGKGKDKRKPKDNSGCAGGLMDYACKWVVQNRGIDSEDDYPFKSADGTCNKNKLMVTLLCLQKMKINCCKL